jgi:hypothetical protein
MFSPMNKLDLAKRAQVLTLLIEGMSLRATARAADVSYNTVCRLFADAGRVCADYQDKALRDLPCKRLQLDEIWSFVYAKAKNAPTAKAAPSDAGDAWTWVAIDADTKLVPSWRVGDRSTSFPISQNACATAFRLPRTDTAPTWKRLRACLALTLTMRC